MKTYAEFLKEKSLLDPATGLIDIPALNPMLFDYQADLVRWALRRGRAGIYADCGLGKGPMQIQACKNIGSAKIDQGALFNIE